MFKILEKEELAPAVTQRGFHVIHGTHAGMAYWVVSDLNAEELGTFSRMFVGAIREAVTQ